MAPERVGRVPIHCLVGFQEDIVSPPWSAVLHEGENVVLEAPVGHITPLFLPSVAMYYGFHEWTAACATYGAP